MNELILGLAISVIIIGFLILAGVALWLAVERRRSQAAQPKQSSVSQPTAPPRQPTAPPPAAAAPPKTAPAAAQGQASEAAPAETPPHKDVNSSGEYPSAALYDQTLLPTPPKRRTRPSSR